MQLIFTATILMRYVLLYLLYSLVVYLCCKPETSWNKLNFQIPVLCCYHMHAVFLSPWHTYEYSLEASHDDSNESLKLIKLWIAITRESFCREIMAILELLWKTINMAICVNLSAYCRNNKLYLCKYTRSGKPWKGHEAVVMKGLINSFSILALSGLDLCTH